MTAHRQWVSPIAAHLRLDKLPLPDSGQVGLDGAWGGLAEFGEHAVRPDEASDTKPEDELPAAHGSLARTRFPAPAKRQNSDENSRAVKFLADTNLVSELIKVRPNEAVMASIRENDPDLFSKLSSRRSPWSTTSPLPPGTRTISLTCPR